MYYGWLLVVALGITETISWGVLYYAFSVFLPLAAWLVETLGWRSALVSLAAILAIGTIPAHALLLRRRPEDLGLHPDGAASPHAHSDAVPREDVPFGAAIRDPTFRWLVL